VVSRQSCAVAVARLAVPKRDEPSNKGMKQTKPAQAMELRSLSPVLGGHVASAPPDTAQPERPFGSRGVQYADVP